MKTLVQFLEGYAEKYSNNPYIWEKKKGKYQPTSYKQTLSSVRQFAAGLMSLGVKKGDRIALLSEGRTEWVVSELGIIYTGAINVPLSVKLTPQELRFRLKHSDSGMLIVSRHHRDKVMEIRKDLPGLKQIILLGEPESYLQDEIGFKKVMQFGKTHIDYHKDSLDERKNSVQLRTVCSQKTWHPKAL